MMLLHGTVFRFIHACADKNYWLNIEIACRPACFQSPIVFTTRHLKSVQKTPVSPSVLIGSKIKLVLFQSSILCCILHSLQCHTLSAVGSFCSQSCPRVYSSVSPVHLPKTYHEGDWLETNDLLSCLQRCFQDCILF